MEYYIDRLDFSQERYCHLASGFIRSDRISILVGELVIPMRLSIQYQNDLEMIDAF
jgi:hypothetical protein